MLEAGTKPCASGRARQELEPRPERSRVRLLGVGIDRLTLDAALKGIEAFVSDGSPHQVITANLDYLRLARRNPEFTGLLNDAAMAVADGMPLVWASRAIGLPLPERVAGLDLVQSLSALAAERGWRVFLLGGAEGVAARAAAVLQRRHPGLDIAGAYSPPVGPLDESEQAKIRDHIAAARPQLLFVALGAPRQDFWIRDNLQKLDVPVAMGVGCSFDVICGDFGRAPRWMRHAGLEWFYRLLHEPGRLWKRYLLHDLPAFFYLYGDAMRSRGRHAERLGAS
jgi:N-acetylglucosaminyldiphosphoundecaprenol N-acetyl-beta-D-mannosaminyltransferase